MKIRKKKFFFGGGWGSGWGEQGGYDRRIEVFGKIHTKKIGGGGGRGRFGGGRGSGWGGQGGCE